MQGGPSYPVRLGPASHERALQVVKGAASSPQVVSVAYQISDDRPVPSKRMLTQEYGIAGGTVDKALAMLRGEGLVKTVRGRGIYVTLPEERP